MQDPIIHASELLDRMQNGDCPQSRDTLLWCIATFLGGIHDSLAAIKAAYAPDDAG